MWGPPRDALTYCLLQTGESKSKTFEIAATVRVCLVVGRKVKKWKVKGVKMESRGKLSNDEK